jgi:hypothetical protein
MFDNDTANAIVSAANQYGVDAAPLSPGGVILRPAQPNRRNYRQSRRKLHTAAYRLAHTARPYKQITHDCVRAWEETKRKTQIGSAMNNEKQRLVTSHIRRLLHKMTDDQLCLFLRDIKDGHHWQSDPNTRGADTVWDTIAEAEYRARLDMINDLTKRMAELSDIKSNMQRASKSDEDGLFSIAETPAPKSPPTPWPH